MVEPHGNVDQDRLIAARQNYGQSSVSACEVSLKGFSVDKHLKQEWNKVQQAILLHVKKY